MLITIVTSYFDFNSIFDVFCPKTTFFRTYDGIFETIFNSDGAIEICIVSDPVTQIFRFHIQLGQSMEGHQCLKLGRLRGRP